MKLNKLVLLPLLICSFSLASCHPDKQVSQPGFHSEKTSTSYDTSAFQEVLYDLTITGETNLLIKGPFRPTTDLVVVEYSFHPGDWVVFQVGIVYDADVVVTLNGETLVSHQYDDNGYFYQFYMPAQDSVIDISIQGGI